MEIHSISTLMRLKGKGTTGLHTSFIDLLGNSEVVSRKHSMHVERVNIGNTELNDDVHDFRAL